MTDTTLPALKVAPASPYRADRLAKEPPVSSDKAVQPSAKSRLEASRSKLRSELMEIAHPPPRPSSGIADKLTGMVKDVPGVALAMDTAKTWWREHRTTAKSAGQASQAIVEPIARKHPGSAILVAAGIGAGLVLLRPWRLLLRPRILIGAASLIATQAIRTRSASSWLQIALKLAGSRRTRI